MNFIKCITNSHADVDWDEVAGKGLWANHQTINSAKVDEENAQNVHYRVFFSGSSDEE